MAAGMTSLKSTCRAVLFAAVVGGCQVGGYGDASPPDGSSSVASSDAGDLKDFSLRPEYAGPCEQATGAIDVNLGNRAEDFVRAAYCQVNGSEPPADVTSNWANQLRTTEYVRRIDVVHRFCSDRGRDCTLAYSDPWITEIPLTATCQRKTSRDLGAVMMFFSQCPVPGVNCKMDWANTHAVGMNDPHPLLGFESVADGFYNPTNVGFWYRELLDARFAGLQFLLLNVYGPDIAGTPDPLAILSVALAKAGDGIKIGLFDDPWAWGRSAAPYEARPNMTDTEGAAQTLYEQKWKLFYSHLPKEHWYLFQGRPFIYFYNAGTLQPLNVSAAVLARMKQLFTEDFGVEPFVAVDAAYFQDPNMPNVANGRFTWDTLRTGTKSRATIGGVTIDHFMVKWDPLGRDRPGVIASSTDRILKGPALLTDRLGSSLDAQIAVIATWNDLGEGTGIERNYDYYVGGSWQPPNAFMSLMRASQCSD
jgi:hypothetical protein